MTGSAWTAEAQRRRDHRWAVALGAMCLAGTWSFVRVPRSMLRGHWDASLAWMIVLACCGVASAAVWSARQNCRIVARVMTWAVVITWALVLTAGYPFSVPGVSPPVLVALSLCLYPLNLHVSEPL